MASVFFDGRDFIHAAVTGNTEWLKYKMLQTRDDEMFRELCDSTLMTGVNVLHIAAQNGNTEMCKFLIEQVKVDIDPIEEDENVDPFGAIGNTPLLLAARAGHIAIVEYLIGKGADITICNSKGYSALHYAAMSDNIELVKLLLLNGVDKEGDSVIGTPLHYAARAGKANVMKILLENNVDPNLSSKFLNVTPLFIAITSDSKALESVELLLKAGADPNKFGSGTSPLAHALGAKANGCIGPLLKAGADVDLRSSAGLRPIERAGIRGNKEGILMLIKARPRILATPNWSYSKLMNSSSNMFGANAGTYLHVHVLKESGDSALEQKDYPKAISSYSELLYYKPSSIVTMMNRSLCWSLMGQGAFALRDAEECLRINSNWKKAHIRVGEAFFLLKMYRTSVKAFTKVCEMDDLNDCTDR